MSMRKWMFAALTALPLVFLSCPDTSPVEGKTYIVFQNPELFPARMYKDPSRLELFTEVPPGRIKKVEAEPNAGGVTFYPVFLVEMEGIRIDQHGKSVTVRVDEGKANRANMFQLTIETGSAYIKIENASAYPLSFNKGIDALTPLEAASSVVMPNGTAAYQIEPETAGLYKVMQNGAIPLGFPAIISALGEFAEDTIYVFRYDGNALAIIRASPLNASGVAIWKADSDAAFSRVVSGINSSPAATHHIVLTKNVTASDVTFATNINKTITIRGDESPRSIANAGDSALFAIPAGIALRLEANITINGGNKAYNVAHVNGGTFEMNAGSVISGAKDSAVKVDGGTFTMKGGEISGNSASAASSSASSSFYSYGGGVYMAGGTFTMSGGKISGNFASPRASSSSYSYGGGVYVGSNATFTMSGGAISKNFASRASSSSYTSGGGVYVAGGTFSMSGGAISGNSATYNSSSYAYGGGVYVAGGTFSMSGGAISGNTSSDYYSNSDCYGGGVYVAGGTFTMSGGTISGNRSNSDSDSYGGGVFVAGSGRFTLSDGEISWNTANSYGGGVHVGNSATFTMSGGAISENTANSYGGGVYVGNSATFTMSGGAINENTIYGYSYGCGVYVGNSATFTMSGGAISGNSAYYGGGVYVSGGTFTMSDGEISGNTTYYSYGGGVSVYTGNFIKSGGGTISDTNSARNGKVAYVDGVGIRNSTAGPDVNLDSSKNGAAGGWE